MEFPHFRFSTLTTEWTTRTRASDLELDGFVEELGRRQVEAEEEGFVPERRVGRVLDARLRGLLVTLHATDRADVGAGQLTGLDDLHPKLHGKRSVTHLVICLFIYSFVLHLQCFDAVVWAAGRASGL